MKKKLISLLTALSMTFMLFGTPNIAKAATSSAGGCDGSHSGMTAWTSTTSLPAAESSFYLTKDVNLTTVSTISNNITLCLNGHTIKAASGNSIFNINSSKYTLTLCDCQGGGKLTGGVSQSGFGGAVSVNGGTFIMNGGEISGNTAYCASSGARARGGGVYVTKGTFEMNGGEISGNAATDIDNGNSMGGGVYVTSSTFKMNGGKISGNKASGEGGGVYVGAQSTFEMTGGEISDNISGGSYSGGGVAVNSGTFKMSGGTISGNTASYYGGGAYLVYNSTLEISGGEISGNTAEKCGGGVYAQKTTFEMTGGKISGNKLTGVGTQGGGVYNTGGSFRMSSGTISGNEARSGGGVYTGSTSTTFEMSGGTISNNKAEVSGGGVYYYSGTMTLNGSVNITGNTQTDGSANNVYLTANKTITVGSGFSTSSSVGITTENTPETCKDYVYITETYPTDIISSFTMDSSDKSAVYKDNQVQLIGEHNYGTTWSKDGTNHWHECSVCEDKKDSTIHTWDSGKVTTAATCTAKGVKTYTCSVCKQTKTEDIATTGHSTVKIAAVAPTCTATGLTEGEKCSVCGTITKAQTTVAAKGHTLVTDPAAAATCTTAGKTAGEHCSVCNTVTKTQTNVAALGHDFGEWTVTKEAACTTAGTKVRTCKRAGCGAKETETIPANGHNYINGICEVCGTIDAAHKHIGGTATCEGKAVCTICGKAYGELAAHTEVPDAAVAATCIAAGLTEGKHCSVCGTITKTQEIVPALTHDFGEWTVAQAATCTTAGTKERTCKRAGCGAKEMGTIPANGHSYTDGKCTVCGAIDAEHEHTGGTATCKDKAFCAICGEPYGDLTEHTLTPHAAVPATCTTTGNDAYWDCSVCNKIFSDENGETEIGSVPTIPALEHNYVDGTCAECGGTDPTYNTNGTATEDVQNPPDINVELAQENTLIDNVLTAEDKAEIENGSSFEIILEVTDIRDSVSPADVAAASSALKSGEEIGVYVDLSLFKIKDGAERTPIHNASGQIGITLTIPESIYASDRTYSIIRVHNGIVENLGGIYDKVTSTLTFYTDKFSTYAIAFTASSVSSNSPTIPSNSSASSTPTTGGTTPSTPSVPAVTPTVTETTAKEEEIIYGDDPYTEDISAGAGDYENDEADNNIHYILIVVFAAIAGISIIAAKKNFRKKNIK